MLTLPGLCQIHSLLQWTRIQSNLHPPGNIWERKRVKYSVISIQVESNWNGIQYLQIITSTQKYSALNITVCFIELFSINLSNPFKGHLRMWTLPLLLVTINTRKLIMWCMKKYFLFCKLNMLPDFTWWHYYKRAFLSLYTPITLVI